MDIELVNQIFSKIAYFHFLAGGNDENQTLRMPLKKGQTISEQEKGLLQQYFLSLLANPESSASIGIVGSDTITVRVSGFTKSELENIENILKENIKK